MFWKLNVLSCILLTPCNGFSNEIQTVDAHLTPTSHLINIKDGITIRSFYKYNEYGSLVEKMIDSGQSFDDQVDIERLIISYTLRKEEPFTQMPEWVDVSYSKGQDSFLILKAGFRYDLDGNVSLEQLYKTNCPISPEFINTIRRGDLHPKNCTYDGIRQRWVDSNSGMPLGHTNLYYDSQTASGLGGYLLGVGEVILGGAIMLAGGVVEVGSFGTLTVGVAFAECSGAALIGHGLSLTAANAHDVVIFKNDSGTPKKNDVQNNQFDDAVKEIERKTGKKLSEKDRRKLHDQISGQNFGYHDIVEEGVWLFND